MVFCNIFWVFFPKGHNNVTILILIDGFLQYAVELGFKIAKKCHNPYFNRWFSAIRGTQVLVKTGMKVTILILIDGFLQCQGN